MSNYIELHCHAEKIGIECNSHYFVSKSFLKLDLIAQLFSWNGSNDP